MVKRVSQVEEIRNEISASNALKKPTDKIPFRVGKKKPVAEMTDVTTAEDDTANCSISERKVRLSSDIPHSTYIKLYTFAATVQKRINVIINEMILSHISA